MIHDNPATFYCVFVKNRKKFDKFVKANKIKNKYIIDIRKIIDKEELSLYNNSVYLKILIYQKIQQAIRKKKDIYYIPDLISPQVNIVEKLLNIKKMLETDNKFNVIVFCNEFRKEPFVLDEILTNLSKFDQSAIFKDYWLSEKELAISDTGEDDAEDNDEEDNDEED